MEPSSIPPIPLMKIDDSIQGVFSDDCHCRPGCCHHAWQQLMQESDEMVFILKLWVSLGFIVVS